MMQGEESEALDLERGVGWRLPLKVENERLQYFATHK
jgi:hypothetical protein